MHGEQISNLSHFKQEPLKYFELINREHNARCNFNTLKQMGNFAAVRSYNHEVSKWLLQVPKMRTPEKIFHYSQGVKNRIRIEIQRAEPNNLQNAMRIADRIDSLYQSNSGFSSFDNSCSNNSGSIEPSPMQISNMISKQYNRLSYAEKRRCMENNLCFICEKKNCYAAKHEKKRYNKTNIGSYSNEANRSDQ